MMQTIDQMELEESDDLEAHHHSLPVHSEIEGTTTKGGSSRRRHAIILVAVLLLLTGAVLGLVLGLSRSKTSDTPASTTSDFSQSENFESTNESDEAGGTSDENQNAGSSSENETDPDLGSDVNPDDSLPSAVDSNSDSGLGAESTNESESEPTSETPIPDTTSEPVVSATSEPITTDPITSTANGDDTPSPTDTPAETQFPVSDRMQSIIDFLVSEGVADKTDLLSIDTYANKALNWLAHEDPMQLEIPSKLRWFNASKEKFANRYLLTHFYYATGGERWKARLNFLTNTTSCMWFDVVDRLPLGVGCNSDNEITALSFRNNSLQNHLPSELGHLTNLAIFDVDVNWLTGSLPDSFQYLTSLEVLRVGSNGLSGTLSSWIGNFVNLTSANFGYNVMGGSIPSEISSLKYLRELALDHNLFEGDINALFDASVSGLGLLEELFLDSNTFIGTISESFAAGMPNLKELDISDNAFNGPLPGNLFNNLALEVLDVHDNAFTSLPEIFTVGKPLRFFAAQKNSLVGSIPSSIVNLEQLIHLDLSQNQLTGPLMESIGENLRHLRYLFLAENKFDQGPIPLSLANLGLSMRELSLKSTGRTGSIPEVMGMMTNLIFLDLDNNELTGTIPPSVGALSTLKLLLLNRNDLSGSVPSTFAKLKRLEVLFLDGNNLTSGLDAFCTRELIDPSLEQDIIAQCQLCDAVEASCCTKCCQEGEACNTKTHVADLDPMWQISYERMEYTLDKENWHGQ